MRVVEARWNDIIHREQGERQDMYWCYGNESWLSWGWLWVLPIIFLAMCIMMCMFMRSRMVGMRCWGWGSTRHGDLEGMKKEILVLKEEIGKLKGK